MVRLGKLDKLKKSNDLIGTQIRDLPDCSTAPQPSTLRAPAENIECLKFYPTQMWLRADFTVTVASKTDRSGRAV
jgi:hypothetical protein